jgi:phage head maturation protease
MIEAYAALYGHPTVHYQDGKRFEEILRVGCFRKSVRLCRHVECTINHHRRRRLGSTTDGKLRLFEDDRGVRFQLDAELPAGFTGCSVTFVAWRWRQLGPAGFELLDADLDEVCLVVAPQRPAYPATALTLRVVPDRPATAGKRKELVSCHP